MRKILFSDRLAARFGLSYFALLAVTLLVQYAAAFAATRFLPALTETGAYPWLLSLIPLYGFGLPVCLILLRPCPAEPRPKRRLPLSRWLLTLVISLGLMYIGNLIGTGLMYIVSALRGVELANPLQSLVLEGNPFWTAAATVIVAPLGEEFLFRRLVIDHTRRWGELSAVLLSAVMFGAFHLNLYQFFYAFFLGAVFGYIYVKTGRLRYTIALHATVNFLGGVAVPALLRKILPFLERLEQGAFNAEEIFSQLLPVLPALLLYAAYGFLLIGCTLTTVVLGIVLHRRLSFAPGEAEARTLWCNFGVLVFFALCAGIILLSLR